MGGGGFQGASRTFLVEGLGYLGSSCASMFASALWVVLVRFSLLFVGGGAGRVGGWGGGVESLGFRV